MVPLQLRCGLGGVWLERGFIMMLHVMFLKQRYVGLNRAGGRK